MKAAHFFSKPLLGSFRQSCLTLLANVPAAEENHIRVNFALDLARDHAVECEKLKGNQDLPQNAGRGREKWTR